MNTNDRELLELAAKACGELTPSWYNNENYFNGVLSRWNPLEDDGDALLLVVKLGLAVFVWKDETVVMNCKTEEDFKFVEHHANGGSLASTRRAIVRAAAEIAKSMQ